VAECKGFHTHGVGDLEPRTGCAYVLWFRPTSIYTTPVCFEAVDDESTECKWIFFLFIWMDLRLKLSVCIILLRASGFSPVPSGVTYPTYYTFAFCLEIASRITVLDEQVCVYYVLY